MITIRSLRDIRDLFGLAGAVGEFILKLYEMNVDEWGEVFEKMQVLVQDMLADLVVDPSGTVREYFEMFFSVLQGQPVMEA